jgi:hypothetical protein
MTTTEQSYTDRATTAMIEAVREEHDFSGWLAQILATAAAELGSTAALTAGRPGSWEANLVEQLVRGTAGWTSTTSPTTPRSLAHEPAWTPQPTTMSNRHPPTYVIIVSDERAEALAGRDSQSYTSPPQTEQQARQLAGLLAGAAVDGPGPWRHSIAGGQRTIQLHPSA